MEKETEERMLVSFTKLAQYITGLTVYQDIWAEVGKALVKFLNADLFVFGKREELGEINFSNWVFSDSEVGKTWKHRISKPANQDYAYPTEILSDLNRLVEKTLESDFFESKEITLSVPLLMLFLPISHENRAIGVIVVGNSIEKQISKNILDVYLAVAGLAGTTSTRLTTEKALREHRLHLEEKVKVRTTELWQTNIKLKEEIAIRKETEAQREKIIADLNKALSEVKKLSGLLPICSHCKKIRDDKGYWTQIESYIHEHSEAEFSHSICKECAEKYYPDMDIYEE